MRIEVIAAQELDQTLMDRWRAILSSDQTLDSPYFRPEFTQLAGECFANTFVAVLEEAGSIVGFFPFQRYRHRHGRAIGNGMADYQAVIISPSVQWTPRQLIAECGLESLELDHLLASQQPFQPFHSAPVKSYVIDLSEGLDKYWQQYADKRLQAKGRQAGREIGEVRLEVQNASPSVLDELIAMKRRYFIRNQLHDALADENTRRFLHRLHETRASGFAGIVSALFFGNTLVAAQLGLRTPTVMHGIFTSYDQQFARYSPGMLLLHNLIDATATLGLTTIDMGYGEESYKPRMANGQRWIASVVIGRSLPAMLRRWRQTFKARLSGTVLEGPTRLIYRGLHRCLATE